VGYVEANHIADANVVSFADLHIRMLVHQFCKCPVIGDRQWFCLARAVMQYRRGKSRVERCVTPAQGDDCFAPLRNGLDISPQPQSGLQGSVHLSRNGVAGHDALLRLPVNARISSQIAAGAQDDFEWRVDLGLCKRLRHHVVPGRARAGEDDRPGSEEVAPGKLLRGIHRAAEKGADLLLIVEHTFVDLNAAESKAVLPFGECGINFFYLSLVARAGAAVSGAQLNQHLQTLTSAAKKCAELAHNLGGIDEAEVLETGIFKQAADDRHILPAYQLIGHQHASHAVLMGDSRLVSGRQSHAPGSGCKLSPEECGSHRGLSMRRNLNPVSRDELLHPFQVMRKLFLGKDRRRQAQIFAQQIPAERSDGWCARSGSQKSQPFLKRSRSVRGQSLKVLITVHTVILYRRQETALHRSVPPCNNPYRMAAIPEKGMRNCDTLIRNAFIIDGSGQDACTADVALLDGRIVGVGNGSEWKAAETIEADGLTLCPGFIDTHTHEDTSVIRNPAMLSRVTQGVTTVIVGNCGISAAPVQLQGDVPDPMNLLGDADAFRYPTFASYVAAVEAAHPAVNVAAFAGHTSLRSNHLHRLDRAAAPAEIVAMRAQLSEALQHGALGLSTGLAYASARSAPAEEVLALAELLAAACGIYATHMRTEADAILDAMQEAFLVGRCSAVPVVISHLKCAGIYNWGRSGEVLQSLDTARASQQVSCDCYPYAASSSTLDLRQVDERVNIAITWSWPYPEMGGRLLAEIATEWAIPQLEAARRLQPAGAIYHGMSEEDVRRILRHPATMIGSDGLPNDPRPHPRLWGTFPRVLGYYCREEKLFSLPEAIHKMTGLPAQTFRLADRGFIREGYAADLVLLDAERVADRATFAAPDLPAEGIAAVWVNGALTYRGSKTTGARGGRFLRRSSHYEQNKKQEMK
jgi:N-acyl-D-aspartate/D-glutamate deacylase